MEYLQDEKKREMNGEISIGMLRIKSGEGSRNNVELENQC